VTEKREDEGLLGNVTMESFIIGKTKV